MGQPVAGGKCAALAFNTESLLVMDAGAHASAGVPPQVELIRPIGT